MSLLDTKSKHGIPSRQIVGGAGFVVLLSNGEYLVIREVSSHSSTQSYGLSTSPDLNEATLVSTSFRLEEWQKGVGYKLIDAKAVTHRVVTLQLNQLKESH
ncbi:MAG: hypothetical protein RR280_10320 [Bacteroidaceae bacterium]